MFYAERFENFMAGRSGGDRDWTGADSHRLSNQDQVSRRFDVLAPYLEGSHRVLEIGCSSGFMLDAFRDSGLDCVGIEPSVVLREYLLSRGHTVFKSVEELRRGQADPFFDLVVHFFVLEHMPNPVSFFKESLSLLSDGGRVVGEVPCVKDALTSLYDIPAFEDFYWSRAHHYYYSPESLSFVLDQVAVDYTLVPEQRYDLSNHITWMLEGKPGGQGRYDNVFSAELNRLYRDDLKRRWCCDTLFFIVRPE